MSERPWFKCYPSDFLNGVSDLSPNELAVYTVVLMRMYDEGCPIPDDPERIARRCNMRLPACKKAIDGLCDQGKLFRHEGTLCNERARKEIEKRHENNAKQSSNASKRWQKEPEKSNKNNDGQMPPHTDVDADDVPTRDQKPEARNQKPESIQQTPSTSSDMSVRKRSGRHEYTDDFEAFWSGWQAHNTPAGVKSEAFAEWKKHIVPSGIDTETLHRRRDAYCAQCRATDTNTKHVCRWISKGGWKQDYTPPISAVEMARAVRMEKFRREEEADEGDQDGNREIGDSGTGKRALAGPSQVR